MIIVLGGGVLSRRILVGLKSRLKKRRKLITKLEYQRKQKWKENSIEIRSGQLCETSSYKLFNILELRYNSLYYFVDNKKITSNYYPFPQLSCFIFIICLAILIFACFLFIRMFLNFHLFLLSHSPHISHLRHFQ